jgi:hypothetical protein
VQARPGRARLRATVAKGSSAEPDASPEWAPAAHITRKVTNQVAVFKATLLKELLAFRWRAVLPANRDKNRRQEPPYFT